jgi:hypothetical protein
MTQQEQITYLRRGINEDYEQELDDPEWLDAILAVCDLAERALLTDDEAEAVLWDIDHVRMHADTKAVLRRLLPDVPAEHRLVDAHGGYFQCACGWATGPRRSTGGGTTPDAAGRAWVAHAGIGVTAVEAQARRDAERGRIGYQESDAS